MKNMQKRIKRIFMKKLNIILTAIFVFQSFTLVILNIKYNQQININKEITISNENQIKKLQEKLYNYDSANKKMYKITYAKEICLNNAKNNTERQKCIYNSIAQWNNEIFKYLKLLENTMTKEEFKLIQDSQNHWETQKVIDERIIKSAVKDYEKRIEAVEERIKFRALLLREIYTIHTDDWYTLD